MKIIFIDFFESIWFRICCFVEFGRKENYLGLIKIYVKLRGFNFNVLLILSLILLKLGVIDLRLGFRLMINYWFEKLWMLLGRKFWFFIDIGKIKLFI